MDVWPHPENISIDPRIAPKTPKDTSKLTAQTI